LDEKKSKISKKWKPVINEIFSKYHQNYFNYFSKKAELFQKMGNIIGNRKWIKKWENRENGKSEIQKETDEKLYEAAKGRKWDEVEKLLNEGATTDYVREGGGTVYYWTLYWAKGRNKEEAKKVLEKFDQKWKNEIEKNWTIRMAEEEYWRAARIIHWSGKTEIVTNSKHPIIAILRMMGEKGWKGEYSRKIMNDLNLKETLQTDLNFMLENNITEEFNWKFTDLSKIVKEFGFEMEYEELNKQFITNFPLTQTDKIAKLNWENHKIKKENKQLLDIENFEKTKAGN